MAAPVTVVTENRNLRTGQFIPDGDQLSIGKQWEEWLEAIEREFRFFRITDAQDKKDAMIIYGGKEIARLEKSLPDADNGEDEYVKLRDKLCNYYAPKKNRHYATYVFMKMRPLVGESTTAYAARLREKAHDCEFTNEDDRILEHIIQTTDNESLVKKTINKRWTLTDMLEEVHQLEDTSLQIHEMKDSVSYTRDIARVDRQDSRFQQRDNRGNQYRNEERKVCMFCGQYHSFRRREECRAYGKQCNKCSKWNHFAIVCRNQTGQNRQETRRDRDQRNGKHSRRQAKRARDVRRTADDNYSDTESESSFDEDFMSSAVNHLRVRRVQVNKIKTHSKTVPVMLNDVNVKVEPDSGADVNVMDEYQYRAFKHRTQRKTVLTESTTKLSTLQNKLPVKGEFLTTVRNQTRGVETKFVVIKGRINSPPLLGKGTLIELGMLQIKPDGTLKEPNELGIQRERVNSVVSQKLQPSKEVSQLLDKFDVVFQGIGKIADKKCDKDFTVKFSMKPDAVPVAQKPRPIPYYLQEPLKKWLDQCLEEDIFERVEAGDPVTWCSPLVVQPKPRYSSVDKDKLEPHMIRASVDLRVPNKSMERNRILQAPVVEDFTYKFHDCVVFSKMDLKQGYHQLVLDPQSRPIATFSTPWGNMRPKRLIFGAKSSQDLFDEAMYRIFGDIPRCLNQRDDILIGGRTIEEHNEILETVLQ